MAHEWFVQHGGKAVGPLAAAQLKKLAAERKITPATQIRQGAEGAWVAAGRVQGLFAPAATASPNAASPNAAPANAVPPKTAPLKTPPPPPAAPPPIAPPQASPVAPLPVGMAVAQPPWARAAAAQAVPVAPQSMAGKILGAVAIILGTVALATFWLPMLPGLIGWVGIAAGALGLLFGILGLVVAALSGGSGLILNISGTSSAAVGLVLSIVLGVTFGLFAGKTEQVAARPTLPPVVPQVVETPPPAEPEPMPPPEPVWTDASEAIQQGDVKATIAGVAIEQVRMESPDLSQIRRPKPQPMLKVRLTIENTSTDKIIEVPGWMGGGDLIGQGVGQLLGGEAGKALQAATATATLVDNIGNAYKQISTLSVFGAKLPGAGDAALRPGKSASLDLVFPPPLESIEYLRLESSPAGFSGAEPLRFQIRRALVTGMAAPADAAPAKDS